MTGDAFARLVRSLPAEERQIDAGVLLEMYDGRVCRDCGRHHATVWAALACDGFTDAARRREAARRIRQSALIAARREQGRDERGHPIEPDDAEQVA